MNPFDNIPSALTLLDQWVCWRLESRADKQTKVPYHPSGRRADTSNPATWSNFDDCAAALRSKRLAFSGVGFVFNGEGCTGIDFDHHRDATTGQLDQFTQGWVEKLHSYAEVSQSGTGVHVIAAGLVPGDVGRRDAK